MENFKKQVIPDTVVLPSNVELEKALVNLLTIQRNGADKITVFGRLSSEAFYDPNYQAIYAVEKRLFDDGHKVDYGTVFASLPDETVKNAFVASANSKFAQGFGILELSEQIQNTYKARRGIFVCYEAIHALAEPVVAADFLTPASEAISALSAIVEASNTTDGVERLGEGVEEVWEKFAHPAAEDAIPTGILPLDRMLNAGLHKDNMIVVAGRPAMGKTTVALSFALRAAERDIPVLFIEMEMTRVELVRKATLNFLPFGAEKIRSGNLTQEEMRLFAVAKEKVSKFPIHISDKSGLTISDISTMINIYKKKHKIGLVVIDHLGLIRSTAAARNASERAAHVGEMSKTLKSIAKREHLPILVCVQLNRETLKNENFEPQLQNLAESGDIERDADVVLMVHRPEVYQKKGYKGIGQFFVRKQRDGAIGTVHFTYPENISRIEECPIELIPQS